VHRQLVADVPVGAFLSGGLDSSAIVAFAREQAPDIRCFTIEPVGGEDDGTADDLPYARRVAQHLGVSLDVVRIDADRMLDDFQRMVTQLDEPLADPAPLKCALHQSIGTRKRHESSALRCWRRRSVSPAIDATWRCSTGLCAMAAGRSTRRARRLGHSHLDQRNPTFRRAAKLFGGAALEGDAHLAGYFAWAP
jgi:asparagine synthase (glutamine-hydrolysing)